jgi:ketosteroid isomerase-like protein
MSQNNVEIVRQALLASSGGDVSAAEAAFDPSIEWDMSGVTGWLDREVYRGLRKILAFLEGWRQSWDGWRFEVEGVQEGEGEVFGGIRERAKSAATGISVDQRRYFVNTLREGRIVRVRWFSERQDALKAVGLEE